MFGAASCVELYSVNSRLLSQKTKRKLIFSLIFCPGKVLTRLPGMSFQGFRY